MTEKLSMSKKFESIKPKNVYNFQDFPFSIIVFNNNYVFFYFFKIDLISPNFKHHDIQWELDYFSFFSYYWVSITLALQYFYFVLIYYLNNHVFTIIYLCCFDCFIYIMIYITLDKKVISFICFFLFCSLL